VDAADFPGDRMLFPDMISGLLTKARQTLIVPNTPLCSLAAHANPLAAGIWRNTQIELIQNQA